MSSADVLRPGNGTGSLVAESVAAGYGEDLVVKGVSLEVRSGGVVAVVGPNGAGKSTLLKALTGLLKARSGVVRLNGEDVTRASSEARSRLGLGYIPQSEDVFESLRARENLDMGGFLLDKRRLVRRREEVLDVFPELKGLLRRYAGQLSGGERKMLAIARALMPDPGVLLLDEPTAGLSPGLTQRVLEEHVRRLAELGKAILIVEQKAEAALKVADVAYVLVGGAVALEGSGRDVLADARIGEVFLGASPIEGGGSPTPLRLPGAGA